MIYSKSVKKLHQQKKIDEIAIVKWEYNITDRLIKSIKIIIINALRA